MGDIQPGAGGVNRRDLLKRGAVIGGTVWVAPVIQSLGAPAFAQVGSPIPVDCGRMTGGGGNPQVGTITHYGLELHCSTLVGPNNLEVSFLHKGKEVNFHLDTLLTVVCTDDPNVDPTPPDADFDTLSGSGTGHLTGSAAPGCTDLDTATATFKFVDAGEGRESMDFLSIQIWCGTKKILDAAGFPFSGNIQAHDATGKKGCPD